MATVARQTVLLDLVFWFLHIKHNVVKMEIGSFPFTLILFLLFKNDVVVKFKRRRGGGGNVYVCLDDLALHPTLQEIEQPSLQNSLWITGPAKDSGGETADNHHF